MSPNQKSKQSVFLIVLVGAVAFWLDQWSKRFISAHFPEPTLVVDRLLRWNVTQNFHGAFGMFGNNKLQLIAMALAVLAIFWWSFREATVQSRLVSVAFGLILGGAVGNIYDRIHLGFVIDWIDFYKIWPDIFNIADSCITVGVALLLINSLAARRRS